MAASTSVRKEFLQTMAAADLILNFGDVEGATGSGSSATPSGIHPILGKLSPSLKEATRMLINTTAGVGTQFQTADSQLTHPDNHKRPAVARALVSKL